jgi:hypothetical protein
MMSEPKLTWRTRFAYAAIAGILAAVFILFVDFRSEEFGPGGSDFDQLWFAARALWRGADPYALIGPGRPFDWRWPFVYPLSTAVAFLPFAILPVLAARVAFTSLSAAVLAFALSRRGRGVLVVLLSASMLDAVRTAQLSPLLTAAVLLTGVSFAFPLKPHTGLALLAAGARPRAIAIATVTGVLLAAIAFSAQPDWVSHWLRALRATIHFRAPVFAVGGPLLLLAVLRWRRLDARVLLACVCVPHTPTVYDVLPLALAVRTFREGLVFALLTHAALFAQLAWVSTEPNGAPSRAANILNVAIYLPVLVAVLLRPNEGPAPAWLEQLTSRTPAWLRGRPSPAALTR